MAVTKQAAEILKKFEKAKQKRMVKNDLWKELDAFDRGDQWSISANPIPAWMPKPVTNFIHLVKYTKRAGLAMQNSAGSLRPVSPEDVQKVEKLQQIYEFVWDKIKVKNSIRDAIETSRLLGTGITQVFWNENTGVMGGTNGLYEGEIGVKQIDVASFYPDPNAFRLEDCEYVHVVERKPVAWIKAQFNSNELEGRTVSEADRGEIYYREYNTEEDGKLIDFHQHFEKIPDKENGGFKYKVTYLAGDKVVHTVEDLQPKCYPFAVLYEYPQRQDFWGISSCQIILDNQKIINKVEAIITQIGLLLQNPVKVVDKNSGINPQEASKYGHAMGWTFVSNGNPSQAIHWQTPPQIPQALFSLLENAKENIREITGLNDAYTGSGSGSLQTSTGVEALIERATLRDRDQMHDIEDYIHQLSRLVLKFITTMYDTPRFMRIAGEDPDKFQFEQFVGTDFYDMEYDFQIDISERAAVTRAREMAEAEKLIQFQGQYGESFDAPLITGQEFMKMSNFVHKKEIIQRMKTDVLNAKAEEAALVAQQLADAVNQGLPPEQLQQMALEMFQALEQDKAAGIGSANMSTFQNKQGSPA
jgi:hypothetical protein